MADIDQQRSSIELQSRVSTRHDHNQLLRELFLDLLNLSLLQKNYYIILVK